MTVNVGGCHSVLGDWTLPMNSGGHEVGIGIFDGTFTMPASSVGEGSMTFPLSGEVTGAECPFHHFNTALCSLTWDAVVTSPASARVSSRTARTTSTSRSSPARRLPRSPRPRPNMTTSWCRSSTTCSSR